ncbi:MAG: hypothetical protein ACRDD2_01725 [Sarcina sp.]
MKRKFNSLKYILAITKCSLTIVMVVGFLKFLNFKYLMPANQFLVLVLMSIVVGFIAKYINEDINFKTFNNKSRTENNLLGKKMVTIKWYLKLVLLFLGVKDFLYDNMIFSENVVILNVFKGNKVYLDRVFVKKNKKTLILEYLFLAVYTVSIIAFMVLCIKYVQFAIFPVILLFNGDNLKVVHKPLRKLFL